MLKIGESGEAWKKVSKNLLGKYFWRIFLQNRTISVNSAGTYINMQDAYAVEAQAIGDWNQIGYTGPGSNASGKAQSNVFYYSESKSAPQWAVKPLQKLNDCAKDQASAWTLSAAASTNNATTGHYDIAYTTGGQPECLGLTPSFAQLVSGRNQ